MSVHDVDKASDGRGAPLPNVDDKITQRKSEGTTGIQNKLAFQGTQNLNQVLGVAFTSSISIASGSTLSWNTIRHGLPFTPDVKGYLDNASVGSISSNNTARIPLPTFLNLDLSGSVYAETQHLNIFADDTNVYILLSKGISAAAAGPVTVTYFLERGVIR